MAKKEKVVYKEKVNWKKEAALLPGYLIVLIWIAFYRNISDLDPGGQSLND